uniref:FXYD domain-containing ion transport regulator n=1 Tax=Cyprinus carpio TaxID=7962 RepID=A0A8C1S010_CYPCA
ISTLSEISLDSDYYETLRTTGVILAVVMFVTGILIALSKSLTFYSNAQNPSKSFSHKCAALTVHVD